MKEKDNRARIKLEDGSVIHCTAKEIPLLIGYRDKARMDTSMFLAAYLELTGNPLPKPTTSSNYEM